MPDQIDNVLNEIEKFKSNVSNSINLVKILKETSDNISKINDSFHNFQSIQEKKMDEEFNNFSLLINDIGTTTRDIYNYLKNLESKVDSINSNLNKFFTNFEKTEKMMKKVIFLTFTCIALVIGNILLSILL